MDYNKNVNQYQHKKVMTLTPLFLLKNRAYKKNTNHSDNQIYLNNLTDIRQLSRALNKSNDHINY